MKNDPSVPETRVKLKRRLSQVASDYVNANFVTGYNDDKRAYVATQAPLDSTVADFWRMVWEQQSRVIIMLTAMEENGHPKCAHYLPDCLGDSLQRYGDFMILLKKKDVHQEYIISILELKDIENNLVREVKHCWYTAWPQHGSPEPISLVKFILDTRVFYEDSGAPLIVHCSPGTGRTGTFIGTDICMRQYENLRIVDILHTVYRLRKERAGSVQTKEQYTLIYNALNEYASVLSSPAISTASSSMTLHSVH
ncbi:tyrosine-protein phosphatase non-receptor type 7-like [Haliotis rubra]|uniref:tyrosine-protein phosphatase non-receptor type 7-like n=1 Tax=Haliotis rubra TaxID=36100 RepID=UPI001EE5DBEF|nr:tyrosine-protein phosphatase non-receptor type 7-like [Haliotis rubra]